MYCWKHFAKTVNYVELWSYTVKLFIYHFCVQDFFGRSRWRTAATAYFFMILILYFIYLFFFLSFKFGWVVNKTLFCGVTKWQTQSTYLILSSHCHGAHTREEQEHADEDINSNDNI